ERRARASSPRAAGGRTRVSILRELTGGGRASAHELVAESVQGEDELRMAGVRLGLAAGAGPVDGPRARRGHRVVAPDPVQQLVAGERRPAVLDEVAQELELLGREPERERVARDLGAAEVDLDGPEAVEVAAPGTVGAAAEPGLDPGE